MNTTRGKGLTEKPVVIVRKKAGTRSSLSPPTQPPPRVSAPIPQTAALAIAPPPPAKLQQPVPLQASATPVSMESGPSKKEREKQVRRELLEVMRDRWPQAFPRNSRQVRPLAIGIHRDLAAALPGHSHRQLGAVFSLFRYLAGPAYFQALLRGGPRYDLDGNPRGEVTPEEQEQAKRDLDAFLEQRKRRADSRASTPHRDSPGAGVDENKK